MLKLNKSNLILLLSLALGVVLFVSAMQQADLGRIQVVFRDFPWYMWVLLCLLNALAAVVMSGARWQVVLRAQDIQISFVKVMEAKMVGYVVNYITPAAILGGEPVRAYMVNAETGVGWKKTLASVVIEELIFFAMLFLVVVLSFLVMLDHLAIPFWATVSVFGLILLVLAAIFNFYQSALKPTDHDKSTFFVFLIEKMRLNRLGWVERHLPAFRETDVLIENFFREHRKAFQWAVWFSALEFLLYILLSLAICRLLGARIDFLGAMQIFSLTTLANLTPIPAALGVFEMMLTVAFELLGLSKDSGFAFSLLMRGTNIALCLAGLVALGIFVVRNMSRRMAESGSTPPIFAKLYKMIKR